MSTRHPGCCEKDFMVINERRLIVFYIVVRIVFCIIVYIILRTLLIKTKIGKKILEKRGNMKYFKFVLPILCISILSISSFLPIENLFISFKSPKTAFYYSHFGKVEDVVYGKNSCFIFSSNKYVFIPKDKNGYKLPSLFPPQKVYHKQDEDGIFDIYKADNTNDFYIVAITISKSDEIKVTDCNQANLNTKLERSGDANTYSVCIYGYINYSDGYYLNINDEKILLSD